MEPKALLIKLRQLRQSIKAAIVIEAGQRAPDLEPAPDGPNRGFELLFDFGQGDDLLSAPAPEQRGGCILDPFHGRERELGENGTLYDGCLKLHIVCQTLRFEASKTPMFLRV